MVRPFKIKKYKTVGLLATIMAAAMVLLYIIPGSGCTLSNEEWMIAGVWMALGVTMAVVAKAKYKDKFGRI